MSKIKKISGFPEWLPKQKLLEDRVICIIRGVYESYGFTPIETPSVELVSTLLSKGVIDKEIYLLKRARQEEGKTERDESELALHFDLTVPLARYVAQHFNELTFPFKRYQLQKVWRGERPQKGRFREFYQFDIDTIAKDELPLSCDAEVISAVGDVFTKLSLGSYKIRVNSRKILLGIYESLGLDPAQRKEAIIAVDKIDKIGRTGVAKELAALGISQDALDKILEAADIKLEPQDAASGLSRLDVRTPQFDEGRSELLRVIELIGANARGNLRIDLSLARGLDYYTGLIFEVVFDDYPEFGSVCSGGRYDDLASQFINKKLPGVGVSIGLTRLMDLIFSSNLMPQREESAAKVLIAVYDEAQRVQCNLIADKLRALGIACEVYYKSPKLGKQIDYAASAGIPYIMFVQTEGLEVKNLKTKQQSPITTVEEWARTLNDDASSA